MSDIGLSSNIYRISNKYLEKLNSFLVEINFKPNQISEEQVQSIHIIIKELADKKSKNFHIQMIFRVIDSFFKSKKQNTHQVLKVLLKHFENNTYMESEAIEKVEMLAIALDKECDYAFSRIQGK